MKMALLLRRGTMMLRPTKRCNRESLFPELALEKERAS
jgi:hypothetical protein